MSINALPPTVPPKAAIARVTLAPAAPEAPSLPSMPRDRWVSQTPPIPDPPAEQPTPDPWRDVPGTMASSALHSVGAGAVGAIIGALLGGPVGAAMGAGIGTTLGQGYMQALLGMADGGNTWQQRLGAAVPGALSLAGGIVGGLTLGTMGVTVGVLAAPLLAVAGYGLYKLLK